MNEQTQNKIYKIRRGDVDNNNLSFKVLEAFGFKMTWSDG